MSSSSNDPPAKSGARSSPGLSSDKTIKKNPGRSASRLKMPDLPRDQWCDFRIEYVEGNKTLVQLAREYMCDPRTVKSCIVHNKSSHSLGKYMCDPRTVKSCIVRNKSSHSLGKQSVPTRIDLCRDEILETLLQTLPELPDSVRSIYQLSNYLLPVLREKGYKGGERTLRNYLHVHPAVKAFFEKKRIDNINIK